MNNQQMLLCLWYNDQAEEAAKFYCSIFENSSISRITRYGKEGFEFHRRPAGTVMLVEFSLNGMSFQALNGGPQFVFNEATSIVVPCETQEEIDHYWNSLTENGEEGPCGWLKDRFGVSWQIVPSILPAYLADENAERSGRVTAAFLQMKKFDIAKLKEAYQG